jgi:enterochelin esterase family protein
MEGTRFVHDPFSYKGRVEMRPQKSRVLASNRLEDPTEREVPVYLPPGWDEAGAQFPVIFMLAGFTGRGQNFLGSHPWKGSVVQTFDRAVARGACPPAILVMPDCFTAMGGGQYINSAFMGRYEDYIMGELVSFVDATYPTLPGRRGVIGKSSGGFGAMSLSMRYPEIFSAAASISGDCHFEYGYVLEFLAALRCLQASGGSPQGFLDGFYKRPILKGDDHALLNTLAMSACYSPALDQDLGFELPFDCHTGRRNESVWQRWLEFDPVYLVESCAPAWRSLDFLHLEAGQSDEFHLQFGLRILGQALERLEIPHRGGEFAGGHFDINHRYQHILPSMIAALAG